MIPKRGAHLLPVVCSGVLHSPPDAGLLRPGDTFQVGGVGLHPIYHLLFNIIKAWKQNHVMLYISIGFTGSSRKGLSSKLKVLPIIESGRIMFSAAPNQGGEHTVAQNIILKVSVLLINTRWQS